ncbi:MAG TPA: cytochrome P450 [Solirubrobacteraceae bacterium]|jgi:cytochrome P450|nr:cytochrome P450 [Solirubrobacteraceae bacterium]
MQTTPALPPGPRLPRAVQSVIWYRRAQWLMDQCQARFGDMFTLRIANEGDWVLTSDPDTIKQVFTGDPRLLHAGEANRILLPVLGPDSVLLLDDAPHLRQRRLMLPAFHGERMQRYGALMADVAAREIERWPLDEPYPLRPRMQAMTLEIVLRAVFGVSEGPRMEELRRELRRLLDAVTDPVKGIAMLVLGADHITRIPAFRRELGRVNGPIYAEIAERRTAADLAERDDIMSLLLQATHEDGSPMSDSELRDELLTLLVAGHETTANALSWAVERLCRHPAQIDRLTDEVRAGEDAYLQAAIQETLRLRPVISIVLRRLQESMELGGRLLPAGCSIVPSIHLVHRRADIYPEPNEFQPERFLEAEGGRAPGTYTWIPFGGGIRRCLGAAFAQFEMEVVLRELVLRRTLAPSRPGSERNYRRAITETPRRDAEVIVGRCPVAPPAPASAPVAGAVAEPGAPAGPGAGVPHGGGVSLDVGAEVAVEPEVEPEATPA